jgi:hypothetical protein
MNTRGLLSKFPAYAKPSYEAFIHKKVDDVAYDLAVAIPSGKRAFLWFTMSGKEEICCIIEIGRNQMLQDNIHKLDWKYPPSFSLGTLLSGYLLDGDELCPNHKYFIADDLFSFEGYEFGNPFPTSLARKFEAFSEFFRRIKPVNGRYSIHCIVMWDRSISNDLPLEWACKMGYKVKHIQYRSSQKMLPYANYIVSKNPWECGGPQLIEDVIDYVPRSTVWSDVTTKFKKEMRPWNVNFFAPIHTKTTLFWVSADITYDMYYLFVQNDVLYQYAFIPDHKTSVMMNTLFRRIVENDCLDKVEESEDEEEFENIRDDKYVDLTKKVLMECVFHHKFKKWVPRNIVTVPDSSTCVPPIEDFLHPTFKYMHNKNEQRHKSHQSVPNHFRIQECRGKKEKNYYQEKKKQGHQTHHNNKK